MQLTGVQSTLNVNFWASSTTSIAFVTAIEWPSGRCLADGSSVETDRRAIIKKSCHELYIIYSSDKSYSLYQPTFHICQYLNE